MVTDTLDDLLDEARQLPAALRLEWLIEFGDELPEANPAAGELHRLAECQSPVFWAARVDDGVYHLAIEAPASALVVRGFAGLVVPALDAAPARVVADAPADLVDRLQLSGTVSGLRLRGLHALWGKLRAVATDDDAPMK